MSDLGLFHTLNDAKKIFEGSAMVQEDLAAELFTEINMLFLSTDTSSNPTLCNRLILRELLELAIIASVRMNKFGQVLVFYSRLSPFYFDQPDLPKSYRMTTILGAILFAHLINGSKQQLALLLSQASACIDVDFEKIDFVLEVERLVESNAICKLLDLQSCPPSSVFENFVSSVVDITRQNVVNDILCHSPSINIKFLMNLLYIESETETVSILQKLDITVDYDGNLHRNNNEPKPQKRNRRNSMHEAIDLAVQIAEFG